MSRKVDNRKKTSEETKAPEIPIQEALVPMIQQALPPSPAQERLPSPIPQRLEEIMNGFFSHMQQEQQAFMRQVLQEQRDFMEEMVRKRQEESLTSERSTPRIGREMTLETEEENYSIIISLDVPETTDSTSSLLHHQEQEVKEPYLLEEKNFGDSNASSTSQSPALCDIFEGEDGKFFEEDCVHEPAENLAPAEGLDPAQDLGLIRDAVPEGELVEKFPSCAFNECEDENLFVGKFFCLGNEFKMADPDPPLVESLMPQSLILCSQCDCFFGEWSCGDSEEDEMKVFSTTKAFQQSFLEISSKFIGGRAFSVCFVPDCGGLQSSEGKHTTRVRDYDDEGIKSHNLRKDIMDDAEVVFSELSAELCEILGGVGCGQLIHSEEEILDGVLDDLTTEFEDFLREADCLELSVIGDDSNVIESWEDKLLTDSEMIENWEEKFLTDSEMIADWEEKFLSDFMSHCYFREVVSNGTVLCSPTENVTLEIFHASALTDSTPFSHQPSEEGVSVSKFIPGYPFSDSVSGFLYQPTETLLGIVDQPSSVEFRWQQLRFVDAELFFTSFMSRWMDEACGWLSLLLLQWFFVHLAHLEGHAVKWHWKNILDDGVRFL